jgi:PPOX class probable F420-dependent enzyme
VDAPLLPDAGSEFGRRVRGRLRDEQVIWLTTCGADGTPQPNPVWFVWQEPATLLIYNRADARRLAHLRRRQRVAAHFDGNGRGGDVVVLTGKAELLPGAPGPHEQSAYAAKYHDAMIRVSGSLEAFAEAYPVAMAVRVDRVRGF